MKYAVITFGCRVNQADSLAIEAELAGSGAQAAPAAEADLVVVNTCSVTASADQGARQTIRRIARDNPAARVVATGCYATRCADEVAALPGVAAVVPNEKKTPGLFFVELHRKRDPVSFPLSGKWGQTPFSNSDGPCGQPLAPGLMGRTAWTLRVQTGCEETCSYCIIPRTRGASRSRSIAEVRDEVARVLDAGYREIALTGVHLGSYGRDLCPRASLDDLLRTLVEIEPPAPVLFRISSLEPMDCTDGVVDLVADSAEGERVRFAPHFHLPLQHASNRLLRAMRRPYTIEQYAALVDGIRARVPHAAIGTDVIVGFPGETDEDFEALARYLEAAPVTHVHVFPYSERPGTDAAALPGRVHGAVVKARAERIRAVSRVRQAAFRAAQAGSTRPALTLEDGRLAVTDNYIKVPLPPGRARNEWVMVAVPAV